MNVTYHNIENYLSNFLRHCQYALHEWIVCSDLFVVFAIHILYLLCKFMEIYYCGDDDDDEDVDDEYKKLLFYRNLYIRWW